MNVERIGQHTCAAQGCALLIPKIRLMCITHWKLVPEPLKDQVWAKYRGLSARTLASVNDYRLTVDLAVKAVAGRSQA